jgi:glycosyltransferase involved in cell wall biosynthesis
MKPKKVAIITTHIAPASGYGGPAVSLASLMVVWIQQQAHKLLLCSSDASEKGRLKPKDINVGKNVEVRLYHSYWFKRWGFGFGAIASIFSVCWQARTIYINGIATWPTTLAAIICCCLRRRFVIALRGGLMPEHVSFIRRNKPHKWLYYRLLTFPTLRRAATIHCITPIEAKAARQLLGDRVKISIIPNGVDVKNTIAREMPTGEGVTLCYVGRISREKGINSFLKIWLNNRRQQDRFIVAGSGITNDSYYQEFEQLVTTHEDIIDYRGYLAKDELYKVISESHFVVLPSGLDAGGVRENFGNSVAEALSLGRPAIVSKGLAWDNIAGAGFVFELNKENVRATIQSIQTMTEAARREMGKAARQYAEAHLDIQMTAPAVWQIITDDKT